MHPDFSLVLQKCASNLSLKHKQPVLFSAYVNGKNMSDTTAEVSNNSPDDHEDLVRIVSDEEDEAESDELALRRLEREDNISLCSELSVGKENAGEERACAMEDEEEDILDISDTHSNSSNEEMQHSPSIASQESHINPFALANTLRFPVPFGLPPNNAAVVANISPFQEEFLRKSHLYAEELMKHQMQLMAAARASAFSLRSNSIAQPQLSSTPTFVHHLNPLAKIGQLSAAAAAALTAAAQQNHKPLNHSHHTHHMLHQQQQQQPQPQPQQHHQILHPHQYTFNNETLAKLTDLSKQHSSPATPNSNHYMMSTLNQLQTQMQAHLPGLLHDNNDNLHERALKFSIDNILKADFGRTNSLDSLPQTRKSGQHKSHCHRQKLNNACLSAAASTTILNDSLEQANLNLSHNISPSTQTFSSSLATICTNSNDSSSTAVSSSYSSVNGATDLIKSSPSQTPTLSPGFCSASENGGSGSNKNSSKTEETAATATSTSATGTGNGPIVWPAWVYCTRYSDRPSSGRSPRVRKPKTPKSANCSASTTTALTAAAVVGNEKANSPGSSSSANNSEDKRPRTAFSGSQLARLKHEFNENRYLTEKRRQQLSSELGLNEAQIKIWFQNKRAKLKKSSGVKNPLALQLMAQGLYNHSTIPLTREEEELQELQEREKNNNTSSSSNNSNSMQQQQAAGAVSS